MRQRVLDKVEEARVTVGPMRSDSTYGNNGLFIFGERGLRVIASDGGKWDHVSVSKDEGQMPTWEDMCWVKGLFFREDECVMQLHPPKNRHINHCPNCLHMWRPQKKKIPQPPLNFV